MRRWLLLIPLAAILMAPGFLEGPGWTHSQAYDFVWTRQFGLAIASGDLYPRWLPASFEGLGSPTFYFYPPFAFWISGAFDAAGLTTLQAINAAGFVLLLASGLTMYGWLGHLRARPLLGASLYMLAPYHLFDFYTRGALAEFAAFVWMPLIALAIQRLPERRASALLAISFAGLILSHLPMALLVSVFLIAPLSLHRARSEKSIIVPGLVSGALGIMLAAFYLLPALSLQDQISGGLLWGRYYQPQSWFLWNADARYLLALPTIGIAMALLSLRTRNIWTVITVTAAAAVLGLIPFIWSLPILEKAQFPWRLLGVAEFAGVTALVLQPPTLLVVGLSGAILVAPYTINGVDALIALRRGVDYPLLAQRMPDAPEYLPQGFDVSTITDLRRYIDLAPYRGLTPGSEVLVRRPRRVTLHHAAFPIWEVTKNGREVPSSGPLITFDATPGLYRLERVTLWQEWVGWMISLLAAALMFAGALSYNLRKLVRSAGRRAQAGPVEPPHRPRTEAKPS